MLARGEAAQAQTLDTSRPSATAPFAPAKGSLQRPVDGDQVVAFGQPTAEGLSSGVLFKAQPGASVVAPCAGTLVYVGEFRSYGNLIIIAAGDDYHLLLSGLSLVEVEVGQRVQAGDRIGTLPRTTADGSPPMLHVELRKDQQPIDPTPWWRKG